MKFDVALDCERTSEDVKFWTVFSVDSNGTVIRELDVVRQGAIVGQAGITFKRHTLEYGLLACTYTVGMVGYEMFNSTGIVYVEIESKYWLIDMLFKKMKTNYLSVTKCCSMLLFYKI